MTADLTRFYVSAGEERGEALSYLGCDRPGCFWELYIGGSSLAEMVAAAQEHEQEKHPSR